MKTRHLLTLSLVLACPSYAAAQPAQDRPDSQRLQQLLKRFPEADTNKDGILTPEEAQAYARTARGRGARQGARDERGDGTNRASDTAQRLAPTYPNVKYGAHERNVLDLWRAKSKAPAPLVVFIHGGGFTGGDKRGIDARMVNDCLAAGVSVMSINYRYLTSAALPEILRDCARAIQFVRYHAKEYNIDPARIASYGGSAGAGTSLWLAFHPDLADPKNPDPVLRESTRLVAAGSINGQASYKTSEWESFLGTADFPGAKADSARRITEQEAKMTPAEVNDLSMLQLISKDDPPVFLYNSQPDGPAMNRGHYVHHPGHARAIKKRCDEAGVPALVFFAMAEPHTDGDFLTALRDFFFAQFKKAAPASAAATPASHPDYSLAGIVQGTKAVASSAESADSDIAAAIGAAQLLYTTDGAALRSVLQARNRLKLSTPVIVYMGGLTTNPSTDIAALERELRPGIAMTPVAKLATDIDATTKRITLADPKDGELAIKASTAAFSEIKNTSKFCFWLRVDDELMKVTAVDAAAMTITVERGFDKSAVAAHKAGASVLSPVYLGNRDQLDHARHTNSWPGGPDYLRYAMDPRQPAAQKFKAGVVISVMSNGYDGAWFDTFQPRPYNFCDALGRKVTYFWDFKTGGLYNLETYLDAIKEYIRGVRAFVRASTGREPVLFANSASGSYTNGTKELFNHGDVRDLMDGYCFEDSYLRVRATRDKRDRANATKAEFIPYTGKPWLNRLANHADAASSGLRGYCMAGPAGYLAQYINTTQPNYAQLLRYSYASFLLTVTKERTTMFGWPMHVSDRNNTTGIVPWPRVLYAGIGDPLQENKIDALKLPDSPCYMRRFENGLAIVNPSAEGTQPVTVPIPAGYIDAMTGKPVHTLTLGPADGAILIRRSETSQPLSS